MKVPQPPPPKTNGFSWNQSSMDLLNYTEKQLLACLNSSFSVSNVPLVRSPRNRIWTLKMNDAAKTTPLVMVHGLGGGIGLWVLNLDSLSEDRPVYAMDVLGFGKSSRPQFSLNPSIAEIELVDSLQQWRDYLEIRPFHLLGHSFGGYLAALYALRFPNHVKSLILVEPWGVMQKPPGYDERPRPLWVRAVTTLIRQFDPFAGLRVAGPWGPGLIRRLRPDLGPRFASPRAAAEIVYDYIHQCNVREPASGESVFRTLADSGWARNPLIHRIGRLPSHIPVTLFYGGRSWLDSKAGDMIAQTLKSSRVRCHILPQAGHHVYADQASRFNEMVNKILLELDGI